MRRPAGLSGNIQIVESRQSVFQRLKASNIYTDTLRQEEPGLERARLGIKAKLMSRPETRQQVLPYRTLVNYRSRVFGYDFHPAFCRFLWSISQVFIAISVISVRFRTISDVRLEGLSSHFEHEISSPAGLLNNIRGV